jgi:hypothetical protein
MAAGSLPVLVADEHELGWLPFQQTVPWRELVIRIDRTMFQKNPVAAINALHRIPEPELARKRKLTWCHWPDVDWSAWHSRMATNILIEAASCNCSEYD